MKKIIFICKYNAFRSKIAESYFKKINKNRNVSAISRGFIMGSGGADKVQIKIAKTFGIDIKGKSKPVNLKELINSDIIVVVANDIPKIIFNYQLKPLRNKLKIWKIPDEQNGNERNIIKIINSIKKRVNDLVKQLERLK